MALVYFPVCGTTQGPPVVTGDVSLRASAALTGSYVASTNHVLTKGYSTATVTLTYTKGDEDSCEVKFERSNDGGTTWIALAYVAPQSSSVRAISVDVGQMTATQTVALPPIDTSLCALFRVSAKATGGTPTGTLAISACGGVRMVAA